MNAQIIDIKLARPGDIGFAHSKGFVGGGIRLVEKVRHDWGAVREALGSNYNHVFTLNKQDAQGWSVIQAEGAGVTDTAGLDSVAPGGSYTLVRPPIDVVSTARQLSFLRAQVGAEYGFITDASIVATLFTPRFINVMLPGTWICSAVAAEALRFGGWYQPWPDIYQVTPAQLWVALDPKVSR